MDPNRIVEEDEYAKALGDLVLAAATLELFTVHLAWATIHAQDQQVGKAITKTMSVAQMAQLIRRRAPSFTAETRALLEDVAKRILAINDQRNAFIHSSWTWAELDESGTPVRGRLKFRDISDPSKTSLESEAVPVEEIRALINEAKALFWDLTSAIAAVRPAWMFEAGTSRA